MIDNRYVHELDINLDIPYLVDLTERAPQVDGEYPYRRSVADDPYMQSLVAKFPCLADRYNIYSIPPGGTIPLHVDAGRRCAFNIPILHTSSSVTIFYKQLDETVIERHDMFYDAVTSKVQEDFRFTLTVPTLIDNSVPHKVINYGTRNRVIISWSILNSYTLDAAKDMFSQHKRA